MKTIIFDCETKPQKDLIDLYCENIKAPLNLKDPEKIKQAIEKKKAESVKAMSIDTDYADIFCIGVYEVGGEAKIISLEDFAEILLKEDYITLVGFNSNKFDIPLIIKNGIKRGIDMPYRELKEATNRFSKRCIKSVDLMEVLGEYGKFKSLDTYLQIYLGIKKKEIDFGNCTDDELREHCLDDVRQTMQLYLLFKDLI